MRPIPAARMHKYAPVGFTPTQAMQIIELYKSGRSMAKIGGFFGVADSTIQRVLKRNSVVCRAENELRPRRYYVDESYFDAIDGEEKAYFLRLLFADGCNHDGRHSITLKLRQSDAAIVYAFRRSIRYFGPIKIITPHSNYANAQRQACCVITSRRLSQQLTKCGCHTRKSLTLKFPTCVPEKHLGSFVRGFFDGDGTICIPTKGPPFVTLTCSHPFADGLNAALLRNGIWSTVQHLRPKVAYLNIYTRHAFRSFYRFMYDSPGPKLPRKAEKFDRAMKM